MLVYLSGPIDAVDSKNAHEWRDYVSQEFALRNIMCCDPSRCFTRVGAIHKCDKQAIMRIDRAAVVVSDIVYAYVPTNQHMIGTIREIEFARALAMHVIVVTDKPNMCWLEDCHVYKHHTNAMEKVYSLYSEWKQRADSQ